MPEYHLIHIKDPEANNTRQLAQNLLDADFGAFSMFGTFFGLFGLASNELFVVMMADDPKESLSHLAQAQAFNVLESFCLEPTVRPKQHAARHKQGIYVFRFFDVQNKDVDEIARLSEEAWVTFEGGFDFLEPVPIMMPPPGSPGKLSCPHRSQLSNASARMPASLRHGKSSGRAACHSGTRDC